MNGTSRNDVLVGGPKNDKLFGKKGNDTLLGDAGNDLLHGGKGHDTLIGGKGHDWLFGGSGYDTLVGGKGNDWLFGGNGNDTLLGGAGNDYVDGGKGNDRLVYNLSENLGACDFYAGGKGCDTLVLELTYSEYLLASVQQDIEDFEDFLACGRGWFEFSSFGLRASGFERLEIVLLDEGPNVPAPAAPVAVDDSFGVDEDSPLVVSAPAVLGNDTDTDSPTLTSTLVTGTANGVLVFNTDGSFTYTPNANFNGSDSFTYVANDGGLDSNIATVTINVAAVNDAPVVADDSFDVDEDNVLVGLVLGNDTDMDALTLTVVTGTANGVLAFNTDGSFSYTPNANFNGSDSFTYLANDGSLDSNIATVAINVAAVNDAPVAVDDTDTTDEDNAVTGDLLVNDTDVDTGDTLTVTEVNGQAANVGTQIILGSGALLTVNSDGSYAYDPNDSFESLGVGQTAMDGFTYVARDSQGELTGMASVSLTIDGMNDAAVAHDDSHITAEDSAVAGNVLVNDIDVDDGDALVVSAVNGQSGDVGNEITLASGALLTLNADGSYTYDPNGKFGFLGAGQTATDSFTYVASDLQSELSNEATVTVTVTGVVQVAVIGANASAIADTAAQLDDSALPIDADAILLSTYSSALDWSNTLAGYDVVVVGSYGGDANSEAQQFANSELFTALSEFVEAGGGVVTTGWFTYALNNMYWLYGSEEGSPALAADYISPISDPDPTSQFNFTYSMRGTTINVLDSGHAITQGVSSYDVDADFHEQAAAIDPTATRLAWGPNASGLDDAAAIAYDEVVYGRTVYMGNIYLADPNSYDTDDLRSGTSDQLLEQAVAWASGGGDTGGMQLTDFAADVIL